MAPQVTGGNCYPSGQRLHGVAVWVAGQWHLQHCDHAVSERHHRQLHAEVVGLESGHRCVNGGHRQHLHQHDPGAVGAEDLQWHRRVSSLGCRCRALPPQSVAPRCMRWCTSPMARSSPALTFTAAQTTPDAARARSAGAADHRHLHGAVYPYHGLLRRADQHLQWVRCW